MARITFSIDDNLVPAAERIAQKERRSLSSYVTLLIERDLHERNALPETEIDRALIKARTAAELAGASELEKAAEELIARVSSKTAEVPSRLV